MRNPVAYARDIHLVRTSTSMHGAQLVGHCFFVDDERQTARLKSMQLWNTAYPNETFDIMQAIAAKTMFASSSDDDSCHIPSVLTYDLFEASSRQMAFHYQVCILPQYFDDKFLKNAVRRYLHQFLYLKKRSAKQLLCPSCDITLVWHCHMLHPILYANETNRITGELVAHEDDICHDPLADGQLLQAWNDTRALWEQHIGDDGPVIRGGIFRGEITATERALRPAIRAKVTDIHSLYGDTFSGKIVFHVEKLPGGVGYWNRSSHVSWVHLPDISKVDGSAYSIDRCTQLVARGAKGTVANLTCRARHRVVKCGQGRDAPRRMSNVLEIGCMSDSDNLPLATAHMIDEWQMIGSATQIGKRDAGSVLHENEKALLLRLSGEDIGILIGGWSSIHGLVNTTSGETGQLPEEHVQREREGSLKLRLGVLKSGVTRIKECCQWQYIQNRGGNRGQYVFDVGEFVGCTVGHGHVNVNLEMGQIACSDGTSALLGYLLGMGASMMYMVLQTGKHTEWVVGQTGYTMIEGVGGQVEGESSYAEMAHVCG